jgi:hypothetical protein
MFFKNKYNNIVILKLIPNILRPFRALNQWVGCAPGWRRGLFIFSHIRGYASSNQELLSVIDLLTNTLLMFHIQKLSTKINNCGVMWSKVDIYLLF